MEQEELSFKETHLKFYFVLRRELDLAEDASDDMNTAYANICEYFKPEDSVTWIKEAECLCLSKRKLSKTNIFILEEFAGEAFDFLQTTKALVIGPRCMLSCLLDDISIPLGRSPIFTIAMRNLIVSASGLSPTEKGKIRNLVQWMGGYYNDDLSASCTHLISNTVKSNKYENAALNDIQIMHPDWVYDVWERSKQENIHGTSKEFEKHKLPIFYALNVTISGLPMDQKNLLVKIIQENGGIHIGAFKSSKTDILIIERNKVDTPKYRAAVQYKKDCLLPDWITDSVKCGYALPLLQYRVVTMKVSTPTKNSGVSVSDFNPDCTDLSVISHGDRNAHSCSINESLMNESTRSTASTRSSKQKSNKLVQKTYKNLLAEIDTQQARKAGTFLDGCCIYLSGFSNDEKEMLNKILNSGGATRFDEVNEKLTHIIVGDFNSSDHKTIRESGLSASLVTLEWLKASINGRQPATEDDFLYIATVKKPSEPEPPSPSSKKNIRSMNHSFKKPSTPKTRLQFEDKSNPGPSCVPPSPLAAKENDLLSQYSEQSVFKLPELPVSKQKESAPKRSEPPAPVAQQSMGTESDYSEMCTEDYENLSFFIGLTAYIHDHDDELYAQLKNDCENAGGRVVDENYRDLVDYAIVPSEMSTDVSAIPVEARYTVNNIWIEDAIKTNKVVKIEYYHMPIPMEADEKPLEGLVVAISIYTANERLFIEALATVLGAIKNDSYAKKQRPLLICPNSEGAKYNAALKWGFPVVTSHWLVACAKTGTRVKMDPYLVGDSIVDTKKWDVCQEPAKSSSSDTSGDTSEKDSKPKSSITTRSSKSKSNDRSSGDETTKIRKHANKSRSSGSEDRENPKENISEPPRETPSIEKRKSLSEMASPEWKEWVHNFAEESGRFVEQVAKENTNKALDESPVSAKDTSYTLKHRRLSELTDRYRKNSRESLSPSTPPPPSGLNISDFVKEVSTPNRETVYKVLKEMENKETPPSQRLRQLAVTPGANNKTPPTPRMPEFVTTPEIEKRRLAFLDTYYLPVSKKNRRLSTPLSELKKRFWKNALGDQYYEESSFNTQLHSDDEPTTSKQAKPNEDEGETQRIAAANIDVKNLCDFIKNRQPEPKPYEKEDDFESVPQKFESEMIGSSEQLVGWKDPSEFMSSRRSKIRGMQYVGTPRFSLSCTTEIVKQKLIEAIVDLKGEICDNLTTFDDTCTHIVCEKPNRGEKILSCIASGKWILSIKYIDDSKDVGHFLDEEDYEWGNPKATCLPNLEGSDKQLAKAAFRWRTKISCKDDKFMGAFTGFRVILHVSAPEKFHTLITAGGGIVIKTEVPYAKNDEALGATHCLVELRKTQLTRQDHKALSDAGVLVLSVMFLNTYLTSETLPDPSKFALSL